MRTIGQKSRVWPTIGMAIVTLMVCWGQAMAVKLAVQPPVQSPRSRRAASRASLP